MPILLLSIISTALGNVVVLTLKYTPVSLQGIVSWDTESYCSTAIHFTDALPEYDAFALTRQISNPSLAATVEDSVMSLYTAAP